MKPQAKTIFLALMRGEILTPIIALNRYKVFALSQCIGNIKNDPLFTGTIVSERVQGHKYHRYYIPGSARNAQPKRDKPIVVREHTRRARKMYDQPTMF